MKCVAFVFAAFALASPATAGELFGAMGDDELTALRDTLSRFVDRHREPAG